MYTKADIWRSTKRAVALALCAGALAATHAAAQELDAHRIAPNALLSIDQNRTTVVDRIVAEWGDALAQAKGGLSVEQLRTTLLGMRSDYLLAASIAGSLDGLRNVVASSLIGVAPQGSKGTAKALGDTADDLVYTPVVPCRIVDTVQVGGAIPGGTRRNFIATTATNFSAQGGSATNCGIPQAAAAVQAIATVVDPPAQGILTIYPYNLPQPAALNLVFPPNRITTTAVTIQLTKGQAFEFTAFVEQTTFLQVDVVGYFARPFATQLECTQVAGAPTSIPQSSDMNVPLPSCAAGWARTGSQCSGTNGNPSGYLLESNANGCVFRNLSSVATYNGTATSICCRVPGR